MPGISFLRVLLAEHILQVASIGALLNILGPSLDRDSMDLLRETLTNGLVLGTIESCVFEPTR